MRDRSVGGVSVGGVSPGAAKRIRVATAAVVLALGAGLLTGCSGEPGTAAVVDGRRITVDELDAALTDLGPLVKVPTPDAILSVMIIAPYFTQAAADHGVGISDAQAQQTLAQAAASAKVPAMEHYSEGALDLARAQLAGNALGALPDGDQVLAEIEQEIKALDPQISPRFGTFDPATGTMTPTTYPWIVELAPR